MSMLSMIGAGEDEVTGGVVKGARTQISTRSGGGTGVIRP